MDEVLLCFITHTNKSDPWKRKGQCQFLQKQGLWPSDVGWNLHGPTDAPWCWPVANT